MTSTRPSRAVLSLAIALAVAVPALGAAPSRDALATTLPLAADGALSIETYKGTVAVTTWEKPEVLVKARIEADDSCGDAKHQAEAVEQTQVKVQASGSGVRVESDYSHLRSHWSWHGTCSSRPFVHYEISMPRTASLRLKDYKSDVRLGRLGGNAEIETYKGTVLVETLDGGLRAQTYKGDIKVTMAGVRRDLRAETYKGSIEIVAPRTAAFTLDAESDRGEVGVRGFGVTMTTRGRRGERAHGAVNGGGPAIHLETNKGTVRLSAS
jgi:hypothetical protein